jgi:hypothetical protein
MVGRPKGAPKKAILLRLPLPLYNQIKTEAKGLSVQTLIIHKMRSEYEWNKRNGQAKSATKDDDRSVS